MFASCKQASAQEVHACAHPDNAFALRAAMLSLPGLVSSIAEGGEFMHALQ